MLPTGSPTASGWACPEDLGRGHGQAPGITSKSPTHSLFESPTSLCSSETFFIIFFLNQTHM